MLTKFKLYFFGLIAFIATAMAAIFKFQQLKDQADRAEAKAKLAKEDATKARAETNLRRETIKKMHEMEQVQQEDMQRILEETKRDYFARKKAKKKASK